MEANFSHEFKSTSAGQEAERILRACVHCGFCTATCPTYRLLGDELDGPRGRIYLIKSLLEDKPSSHKTLEHLDRCLTCRACETTCPSGVEYGKLLDIGRHHAEPLAKRSLGNRLLRNVILRVLPYRERFAGLLALGQLVRPLMPNVIKKLIPVKHAKIELVISPNSNNHKEVILLGGCVQNVLAPNINASVKLLLDKLGIEVTEVISEQCCGALSHHLNASGQAEAFMKANIDAIVPLIESGAKAIISTASGCGVHLKEYGYHFRNDVDYADRAAIFSEQVVDIAEYFQQQDIGALQFKSFEHAVAFQSPCTLQHGQKLNGLVERILSTLGIRLLHVNDAYLCCGSAGVYSILQKEISHKLRKNKLENLLAEQPDYILTSNIGCLEHLRQASPVPIMHWADYLAAQLQ